MPRARNSGMFSKENPRPGPGRKKMTEEEKRRARLQRAADFDYKRELAALFPLVTDQVAEAIEKRKYKPAELARVYEMMRDTIHGKPPQTIQSPGGGPLLTSFSVILQQVDGTKAEKL